MEPLFSNLASNPLVKVNDSSEGNVEECNGVKSMAESKGTINLILNIHYPLVRFFRVLKIHSYKIKSCEDHHSSKT